jgi:lipopolysaccharide assembly outer membrane protein LptD (OstA)
MPQTQFVPKNPKKYLQKAGYSTYVEFANKYDFCADTVRRTMKRYEDKEKLPRENSKARLIIWAFLHATSRKKVINHAK